MSIHMDELTKASLGFFEKDPRKLPEGNILKLDGRYVTGANGEFRWVSYAPYMVYIDKYEMYLYFWFDRDFEKWVIDYIRITGDFELNNIKLYEMYSQKRVNELNKHQSKGDILYFDSEKRPLGDSIVKDAYTYHLGNMKYYFVERYARHEIKVTWTKGGI